MKKYLVTALVCGLLFVSGTARAQKYSIQTNVLDWATLFTFNLEGGISMSQHFSAHLGFRYNPWSFEKSNGSSFKLQQTAFYGGVRYWPWYVNSGFWVVAKLQYQSFNYGGFSIPGIIDENGWQGSGGFGPGIGLGYTFMLNESVNLEVGAGGWVPNYRDLGLRVLPDFLSLSFVYVF
ncbi:MAG: DUF3575 domain-containing protein [Bacteroidales bacterium]|nr:DUF3575 domain-containing protein [Bacteroidales bacterium]